MTEPLIRVRALTMGWDGTVLQKDATFHVDRGEVFAILGASGCGKSTLMRTLVGLEAPISGEITIAGVGRPNLEAGRPPFGVMFQGGALFGSLTVGENVGLQLEEWTDLPYEAIGAIVRAKLKLVGLEGAEDKLPSEISGGMKKRAAIARAMALEPDLLFLDEPSAGLDPGSAVELDELVLTLNRVLGLTLVLVTHELPSILKIATRCIMLDRETQSIIVSGDPRVLRDDTSDPRVHRFFNRLPRES
ncbi:MAG TPA: ATP-binding cassette domain-containing protein [Polyangiaceae bacterium]